MRPIILFLGDSITIAYAPIVRELLTGEVEVRLPEDNAGTSTNLLAHLDKWLSAPVDIIHFNCGLHDLAIDPGASGPRVSVEAYTENLRTLRGRLEATSAQLIWATITPVIDDWHKVAKGFCRHLADVRRYNDAARMVMTGLPMNDLYAKVIAAGLERCICEDGVHMREYGNRLLAETVAQLLRTRLSVP